MVLFYGVWPTNFGVLNKEYKDLWPSYFSLTVTPTQDDSWRKDRTEESHRGVPSLSLFLSLTLSLSLSIETTEKSIPVIR